MRLRRIIYIVTLLLTLTFIVNGQTGQDELRREVKLYNPFKPSLNKASKLNFFPVFSDTSITVPEFQYQISPKTFIPEYQIRSISAAKLEPDPLPELYKGYLNLGFGNYFTPLAELSISSERSRKGLAGLYARHESSFGKINIEDSKVYGGYMDNEAIIYGTRFLRRSAISAEIDFNHIRRYAYGGDPVFLAPVENKRDSLKIEYFNPRASMNIFSTRLDSSKIFYDLSLFYELLFQTSIYYQHSAGISADLGYDMDIFFAQLHLAYFAITIPNIEDKFRHNISINPAISKRGENWDFKLGLKLRADARYYDEASAPLEYKTKYFFHPDLKFRFSIMPSILNMFVGLDGEYIDNSSTEIIYKNPFIVRHNTNGLIEPSDEMYTLLPGNTQLRVKGGFKGYASEYTGYGLTVSYSLFEDMLFFANDVYQAKSFLPLYDNGELLAINGEFTSRLNEQFSLKAKAGYYSYKMENIEKPWHKPEWDGNILLKYNLRNKILADAGAYFISPRYARYGPMSYSSSSAYEVNDLPLYIGLNLGFEYRYTKILSFWAKLNNIALNRYYEWNFYPSQSFLFMAGFTYSL